MPRRRASFAFFLEEMPHRRASFAFSLEEKPRRRASFAFSLEEMPRRRASFAFFLAEMPVDERRWRFSLWKCPVDERRSRFSLRKCPLTSVDGHPRSPPNQKIQLAKRRAKGFANTLNFIDRAYFVCGKLKFAVPIRTIIEPFFLPQTVH